MTDQIAVDDVDDSTGVESAGGPPSGSVPVAASRPGRFRRTQRISKWDRPPDPHDWRFWVGNLGKVLIATGLLLFGFVAYQLWGTGIETARAQNELESQFEAQLADAEPAIISTVAPDDEPTQVTTAVTTPTSSASPSTGDATVGTVAPDVSPSTVVDETLPAISDADITLPVAVDLFEVAVEQPARRIVDGEVLARLEIPRISDEPMFIVPGVSLNNLKRGPGHYPDTPLPGQLGNASIAGHRTTYGAPFFDVDQLRANDELIVTYPNGDRFVYDVTSTEIVSSSDYYVVTTTDPNIAEMTLTSCHPKYTARDRIVVHSVLNPTKSSNVGISTFYELETDDAPIPGDDPVLNVDQPDVNDIQITETESARGELSAATSSVGTIAEVATTLPAGISDDASDSTSDSTSDDSVPAAPAGDVTERPDGDITTATDAEPAPVDAFSAGWFDDRAAFSQIALWGLALTIISLLAYQVSKKFRHDSIGFLVGIAPFLFALYFFFQNVNRLLPPGI
ncbi:MAG: sortase [Ilumatobacteraceae bacterium]